MKTKVIALSLVLAFVVASARAAETTAPKENVFATKPLGIQLSIKMVGPYSEAADLQIICLFKHKSTGDTYQGAAKDTDAHLGGILSALRNRGEFVGELGETFLFTPPKDSIPANAGTVTGAGVYALGSSVTATATANPGYQFVNWTLNGSVVSTSSSYTFTLTGNVNLVVNFTTVSYTVSLSASPGGAGTVTGAGAYAAGSLVTVTAVPNQGDQFVNWTQNGAVVSSSASYTFTINGNESVVANFIPVNNDTVSLGTSPNSAGTTTGSGAYAPETSVTVTTTPNPGYEFTNWTENGSVVSTSASYTFIINGNESLVANFIAITDTVSVSTAPNGAGTTTGSGSYPFDTSVSVTATPTQGYQFTNWTQNGSVVSSSSSYTFLIQSNMALVANFVFVATNVITGNPGITNFVISGGPTAPFILSMSGTNFGTIQTPFVGTTTNLSVVDYYYLGSAERGYAGDGISLGYSNWINSFAEVSLTPGNVGDAIAVAMFPPNSSIGAVWAGNIPGGPAGGPQIASVQFAGCLTNLMITVCGNNFGPPPVPMPTNTDLNCFLGQDHRVHGMLEFGGLRWGHGSPDSIVPTFMSWTSNKIVLYVNGAAAGFQNGDPLTIVIWQSTDANQTGPQTAWGGLLIQLPLITVGSPAVNSNGFNLVVSGQIGSYEIQASDDLLTWTTIGTVTNSTGQTIFTDPTFVAHSQRYYRALYLSQ